MSQVLKLDDESINSAAAYLRNSAEAVSATGIRAPRYTIGSVTQIDDVIQNYLSAVEASARYLLDGAQRGSAVAEGLITGSSQVDSNLAAAVPGGPPPKGAW